MNLFDQINKLNNQILDMASHRDVIIQQICKENQQFIEEYLTLNKLEHVIKYLPEALVFLEENSLSFYWDIYSEEYGYEYGEQSIPLEFLSSEEFREKERQRLREKSKIEMKEKLERDLRNLEIQKAVIITSLEKLNDQRFME